MQLNTQAKEKAWKMLEEKQQQVSILDGALDDYAAKQYSHYLKQIEKNKSFNAIYIGI